MTQDQVWAKLTVVARTVEPFFTRKVVYHKNNLPDQRTQPVSHALARAFLSRLERQLDAIHAGPEGMRQEFGNDPGRVLTETLEMETWFIAPRKPSPFKLTEKLEDAMGNMFVSSGMSYAEARVILRKMQQFSFGRGAPSKRPETLKLMDARIANHWSYSQL